MVKKTAKTNKPNIQRAREEQWRRRLVAQGGSITGGATLDRDEMGAASDDASGNGTSTSAVRSQAVSSAARAGSAARSRTGATSSSSVGAQRRVGQPMRAGRMKLATQAMSIDEEMHYVKSDIRRLILLTAACLIVLIALSFII